VTDRPGDDPSELRLHRYNTILDELFGEQEVRIVTTTWSDGPEPPGLSARSRILAPQRPVMITSLSSVSDW
jgi:hypothetical protein